MVGLFNPTVRLFLPEMASRPDGNTEIRDVHLRERLAAEVSTAYRNRVTYEEALVYAPNAVVIVGLLANGDIAASLAVEPCFDMAELHDRLAVEPEALFKEKARDIEFPVCVNARAIAPLCDFLAMRPAALNVASALGCSRQFGLNADKTGIPKRLKPYGYTLTPVPADLPGLRINKGAHTVTELHRNRFRVVGADIAAFAASGSLTRCTWDASTHPWFAARNAEAWI